MNYYRLTSLYTIAPAPLNATLPDGSRAINIPAMPNAQEVYASINCYPLDESPLPVPSDEFSWKLRYDVVDGIIKNTWERYDIPPQTHTYKKSYLAQWLYGANLWQQFQALLASAPDAAFLWSVCTEFDSTDERWPSILTAIKTGLSLTDEQVEALLFYGESGQTLPAETNE